MEKRELLTRLNERYPLCFVRTELIREGGNATYAVYTKTEKFFLKLINTAFRDTFEMSVDINLYLKVKSIAVPEIIFTKDGKPFAEDGDGSLILYKFLDFSEIDMKTDAEEVGALIGELHRLMEGYKGKLVVHDKPFYIDRYINILKLKEYPKTDYYEAYADRLWERIKDLPRGYSHGDLYCGNIERGANGRLYVLDFDTSCIGFSMYDVALICNRTDYFDYNDSGLPETADIYKRFLPEYLKRHSLTDGEIKSIYDMLALYHFALQATIIEIYGLNCVNNAFFDKQIDWLYRFEDDCKSVL